MRVNTIERNETDVLPVWDREYKWVHWKDRVFPFVTFYLVHEATVRLLDLLALYPEKSRTPEARETISEYMTYKSSFLVCSLPGISQEAVMEAFYASLRVKYFLLEESERDRSGAMDHLLRIRDLLHFDELFQKWQSPLEGKLCQEQAEEPVLTEVVR
jgi:hypothetical protein